MAQFTDIQPGQLRIIDVAFASIGSELLDVDTDVKPHLIIDADFTDDDTLLATLVGQCRKAIENYCSISLVDKTVTLLADAYCEFELPYGPVNAVTEVKWQNNFGAYEAPAYDTLTTSDYSLSEGEYKRLWVSKWGRIKVTYTVAAPAEMNDLKLAVLNEIAYRYEHRGEEQNGICEAARVLAQPYVRMQWL